MEILSSVYVRITPEFERLCWSACVLKGQVIYACTTSWFITGLEYLGNGSDAVMTIEAMITSFFCPFSFFANYFVTEYARKRGRTSIDW